MFQENKKRIKEIENWANDFYDKLNEEEKIKEESQKEEEKEKKARKLDVPDFSLEKYYKNQLKKKKVLVSQ